MRKKLGSIFFAAAAALGATVLHAPSVDASTCTSQVPLVCDAYTGVARTACQAVSKFADCIQ